VLAGDGVDTASSWRQKLANNSIEPNFWGYPQAALLRSGARHRFSLLNVFDNIHVFSSVRRPFRWRFSLVLFPLPECTGNFCIAAKTFLILGSAFSIILRTLSIKTLLNRFLLRRRNNHTRTDLDNSSKHYAPSSGFAVNSVLLGQRKDTMFWWFITLLRLSV
jgi:hypothetical protein